MSEFLDGLKSIGANVDDVLNRFRGNEAICEKIIKKFPADQSMDGAIKAMEAGDDEQAQKMVHTLKGVASNLGLAPIYELTATMMDDFRAGNAQAAYAKMDELKKQHELFVEAIEK